VRTLFTKLAYNWKAIQTVLNGNAERMTVQPNSLNQEELVNFARLLYGDNWREELPKHLNINRKKLVITLASGDPLPQSIVVPFVSLLEDHLQKQEELSQILQKRIVEIRNGSSGEKQSRAV